MTMLGDAISHAVLPGIALGFLFTGSRVAPIMVLGAALFGLLTTWLVQALQRAGVQEDAGMGVTFTALFALSGAHRGLRGPGAPGPGARAVRRDRLRPLGPVAGGGCSLGPRALWTMGAIFVLDLVAVLLFFKELKICAFDPETASAQGINVTAFHYLLMTLVSITTVGALTRWARFWWWPCWCCPARRRTCSPTGSP